MRRLSQLQERNFWRIVETGAAIASLMSFFTGCFLWFQFDYTRPKVPNPLEGRVYPLNTHGSWVYLDAREHWLLNSLMILFLILAVTAIAIDRLKKPFSSN